MQFSDFSAWPVPASQGLELGAGLSSAMEVQKSQVLSLLLHQGSRFFGSTLPNCLIRLMYAYGTCQSNNYIQAVAVFLCSDAAPADAVTNYPKPVHARLRHTAGIDRGLGDLNIQWLSRVHKDTVIRQEAAHLDRLRGFKRLGTPPWSSQGPSKSSSLCSCRAQTAALPQS